MVVGMVGIPASRSFVICMDLVMRSSLMSLDKQKRALAWVYSCAQYTFVSGGNTAWNRDGSAQQSFSMCYRPISASNTWSWMSSMPPTIHATSTFPIYFEVRGTVAMKRAQSLHRTVEWNWKRNKLIHCCSHKIHPLCKMKSEVHKGFRVEGNLNLTSVLSPKWRIWCEHTIFWSVQDIWTCNLQMSIWYGFKDIWLVKMLHVKHTFQLGQRIKHLGRCSLK